MNFLAFDFGLRLQEIRKSKGYTQKRVAGIMEISKSSISSYENNNVKPSYEMIKAFAVLYRVSADYLLGLEPTKSVILDVDTLEEEQFMRRSIDCLQKELKQLKQKELQVKPKNNTRTIL